VRLTNAHDQPRFQDFALTSRELASVIRITEPMNNGHGQADVMEALHQTADFASAAPAGAGESLPPVVSDVVRHRGSWGVLYVGRYPPPYPNQQAAIDAATQAATQDMANGRTVAVRLSRTDGQVFDLLSSAEHT